MNLAAPATAPLVSRPTDVGLARRAWQRSRQEIDQARERYFAVARSVFWRRSTEGRIELLGSMVRTLRQYGVYSRATGSAEIRYAFLRSCYRADVRAGHLAFEHWLIVRGLELEQLGALRK